MLFDIYAVSPLDESTACINSAFTPIAKCVGHLEADSFIEAATSLDHMVKDGTMNRSAHLRAHWRAPLPFGVAAKRKLPCPEAARYSFVNGES